MRKSEISLTAKSCYYQTIACLLFIVPLTFTAHVSAENPSYTLPIKLGVIIPLTGSLSFVGEEIKNGMLLALEERTTGQQIFEPIFVDNHYDLQSTVSAAQRLIAVDNVMVLITLWDGADVVAPIADAHKVLHISIRWNPDVTKGRTLTFTFESTYLRFAHDQVQLLHSLQVKKLAVLYASSQGSALGANELIRLAREQGFDVVDTTSFNDGEKDFRSLIVRALAKKPDIFVIYSWPPDTQNFIRQLRQLQPKARHTGYYEVLDESELIDRQPFIAQVHLHDPFVSQYRYRFHAVPKTRAAHGYEIIRILNYIYAQLSAHLTSVTPTTLASELQKLTNFESSLGLLAVNKTRNIEHRNILKEYRGGVLTVSGVL